MTRLRHRPDYFEWRGIRIFFHRLQDGPTLARLDPYAPGEQDWLLHSGRTIQVTAEEIRAITFEVHGIQLPDVNPDLKIINDPALEARVKMLEGQVADLLARVATLEAKEPATAEPEPEAPEAPAPAPDLTAELEAAKAQLAVSEAARLKAEEEAARLRDAPAEAELFDDAPAFPEPSDKMADWVDVQAEEDLKTEDLLNLQRANGMEAEQVVQRLTRMKRKKFFELLNVELAELQQERGGPRENLKRESEIESLLGLFARVGEM